MILPWGVEAKPSPQSGHSPDAVNVDFARGWRIVGMRAEAGRSMESRKETSGGGGWEAQDASMGGPPGSHGSILRHHCSHPY